MRLKIVSALLIATMASGLARAQPLSVNERNKAVVMRSETELWSRGNLAVAAELYSPAFICHFPIGPEWRGIDGITQAVKNHRVSFPDWNEHVEDIIAEGNRVAIRFKSTGTQRGVFAGIAPTGREVTISEFAIFRLADGKIVEQWGMPDIAGLMTQITTPK